MCGFEIRQGESGTICTVDVAGLGQEVVERVGFLVDLVTPLAGANRATPDNTGVIERELAPDSSVDFLVSQLGEIGLFPTRVHAA